MVNKEYFITKLSFREDAKYIKDVFAYEFDGKTLSEGEIRQRHWMVNRTTEESQISIMTPDEKGNWQRGKPFSYGNGLYSWDFQIPENITRRKTFVSFYHKDQAYREIYGNLFNDLIVGKSVEVGDIDKDNSDEYIKQLIQRGYLSDTTVLVVLVGPKTLCRKHVDWEISGALNRKVGDNYSGLVGILLPNHPDFGADKKYNSNNLPKRLAANLESGYAKLYDWTDNRVRMQHYIECAFENRSKTENIINNSIPQMQKDTCE